MGPAEPFANSGDPTGWAHSVYVDRTVQHWNAAGTDIDVTAVAFTTDSCEATPEGRNESAFQRGHCTETASVWQYDGATKNVLTSLSGKFGEKSATGFSEVKTAAGWQAAIWRSSRSIQLDANGDFVDFASPMGKFGWTLLTAGANGKYSPADIPMVESASRSNGSGRSYVWVQKFMDTAAINEVNCANPDANSYSCAQQMTYIGEGKTLTEDLPYVTSGNENTWQDDFIFSTGDQWIVSRMGWDYSTNPSTDLSRTFTGGYVPQVVPSSATYASLPRLVKKGKTAVLPKATKQKHPITWTVAKKSKAICSVVVTKKNGVVTKVVVKGLKLGNCTLTGKAKASFFYSAMNKTTTFKVSR